MKQHKSFRFTPTILPARNITEILVSRARQHGNTDACRALNTYRSLIMTRVTPSWPKGTFRFDVPLEYITLMSGETKRRRFPVAVRRVGDTEIRGALDALFYADGSVLVGKIHYHPTKEEPGAKAKPAFFRLLPIALRLPRNIAHGSKAFSLTVTEKDGQPSFGIKRNKTDDPIDLFTDQDWRISQIRNRIFEELSAWAGEIEYAPILVPPGPDHPLEGRFGKDLAPPSPELKGQHYAWPACLPVPPADGAHERYAKFLHLAWTRASLDFPEIHGSWVGQVIVHAAHPTQYRPAEKIAIVFQAFTQNNPSFSPDRQKAYERFFNKLLRHPAAPAGLLSATMTGWREKSSERLVLEPYPIYASQNTTVPSGHDRLEAIELFSDIPLALME